RPRQVEPVRRPGGDVAERAAGPAARPPLRALRHQEAPDRAREKAGLPFGPQPHADESAPDANRSSARDDRDSADRHRSLFLHLPFVRAMTHVVLLATTRRDLLKRTSRIPRTRINTASTPSSITNACAVSIVLSRSSPNSAVMTST